MPIFAINNNVGHLIDMMLDEARECRNLVARNLRYDQLYPQIRGHFEKFFPYAWELMVNDELNWFESQVRAWSATINNVLWFIYCQSRIVDLGRRRAQGETLDPMDEGFLNHYQRGILRIHRAVLRLNNFFWQPNGPNGARWEMMPNLDLNRDPT